MIRKAPVAALACLTFTAASPLFAQVAAVPQIMNFQGRLAKADGTPVSDGSYSVRFSLWDSATGGTEKWNQTLPTIAVKNGVFAAPLSVATSGLFNGNLWLEIKVGADPALAPRQKLASVAYAFKTDSIKDGGVTTASIADGAITAAKLAPDAANALGWLLNGNSAVGLGFLGTTDASPLVFKTANVEQMRLNSTGNLGIGVAFPSYKLDVNGTIGIRGSAFLEFGAGVSGKEQNAGKIGYGLFTANTLDIIGAGPSSGAKRLAKIWAEGGTTFTGSVTATSVSSGTMNVSTGTETIAMLVQNTSATGSAFIASGPYGVTGDGSIVAVDARGMGLNAIGLRCNGGNYAIYATGQAAGTTGWSNVSDARFKTDVQTFPDALETLLKLRGVTFQWRRDEFKEKNFAEGKQVGFIAQEVESILPNLVYTDRDGYKSVTYSNVIPVAVEAVKVLNAKVTDLTQENARLAKENAAIKARLDAIEKAIHLH